jgi:hypothetical protein
MVLYDGLIRDVFEERLTDTRLHDIDTLARQRQRR